MRTVVIEDNVRFRNTFVTSRPCHNASVFSPHCYNYASLFSHCPIEKQDSYNVAYIYSTMAIPSVKVFARLFTLSVASS